MVQNITLDDAENSFKDVDTWWEELMFSFLMSSIFFFPERRFLGNSSGGS